MWKKGELANMRRKKWTEIVSTTNDAIIGSTLLLAADNFSGMIEMGRICIIKAKVW